MLQVSSSLKLTYHFSSPISLFHRLKASVCVSKNCVAMLSTKFKGCLLGVLAGDCLGAPYEGESDISKTELKTYLDKSRVAGKCPAYKYTDDTAMTISVAESLLAKNGFDDKDMASRFIKSYYKDPRRGYGASISKIFSKWNNQNLDNTWKPAEDQFDGLGSFGNGGAMRIAPVPLFYLKSQDLLDVAKKVTKLTHTHPLGINGAILQALCIRKCLYLNPDEPLNIDDYINDIAQQMSSIEGLHQRVITENNLYCERLEMVKKLLTMENVTIHCIIEKLGNNIFANFSIPTAIYCFLVAQQPIPEIETEDPFRRTIEYAISLGGDTDTIASMAGALAGAYYGVTDYLDDVSKLCEGYEKIVTLANHIYERVK